MAPTPILVIGDEELFIEFMGRFTPRDNQLLFASDLTEALGHCRTSQPELFVLPLDWNHQELTSILTEAFRLDAQVLGLSSNGGDPPEYVTRLVSPEDAEAVYSAAAELLQERRQRPRIRHELMVDVDGLGPLRSISLNATSIFVATEAPMDPGNQVTISLQVGDGELSGRAEVTRVGIGEDGNLGMVLTVSPDSATLRHFLESLIRQLLQHEHTRREEAQDLPPAPVAPVDPLAEHQLSSMNRALDVVVDEVSALREQVQAIQRGDARLVALEALEARTARQQDGLTDQQKQLDGLAGRLERLRQQQAALDEALAQRAEEAEGGAARFERLEAAIEAAQKSASYVEESRAGLKGRIEELERGRAGLNESLNESRKLLGDGVESLNESQKSLGDRVEALESLGDRVESLESLGDRVGALEGLGDRVGTLESLGDRVESLNEQTTEVQQTFSEVRDEVTDLMEAIATRVEEVAEASAPAEALARLVKGLEAVGEQQEQLNKTLAEQNRVVSKLVGRLDRMEA